ncbi:MAG: hypothetical protein K8H88_05715 [Sandaracinaceae bacterium]|nr:hypothetical protein [Sandaracinaceae bacterium]
MTSRVERPIEPRFVEVQVRHLPSATTKTQFIPSRVVAQCIEDGGRWGGSGDTLEEGLHELAAATRDVRPSWVHDGYSLEVLVRAPSRAVAGAGSTIGAAIDDALSRIADTGAPQ